MARKSWSFIVASSVVCNQIARVQKNNDALIGIDISLIHLIWMTFFFLLKWRKTLQKWNLVREEMPLADPKCQSPPFGDVSSMVGFNTDFTSSNSVLQWLLNFKRSLLMFEICCGVVTDNKKILFLSFQIEIPLGWTSKKLFVHRPPPSYRHTHLQLSSKL